MQHYYFDIHLKGEMLADDVGTTHFDDGSAMYYGRIVANRISRCGEGDAVRVHVRDVRGRLLTIASPSSCRPLTAQQLRIKAIVERDVARQTALAG